MAQAHETVRLSTTDLMVLVNGLREYELVLETAIRRDRFRWIKLLSRSAKQTQQSIDQERRQELQKIRLLSAQLQAELEKR